MVPWVGDRPNPTSLFSGCAAVACLPACLPLTLHCSLHCKAIPISEERCLVRPYAQQHQLRLFVQYFAWLRGTVQASLRPEGSGSCCVLLWPSTSSALTCPLRAHQLHRPDTCINDAPGTVCKATCRVGYTSKPAPSRTCLSNGAWSAVTPSSVAPEGECFRGVCCALHGSWN